MSKVSEVSHLNQTSFHEAARRAIQQGRHDVQQVVQHSSGGAAWANLPVARFNNAGMRGMVLRRLLLALGGVGQMLVSATAAVMPRVGLSTWRQFALDYFYWRGAQLGCDADTWQRLTHGPLILMYHAIGQVGEPADRYILPVQAFAAQMAWLSRHRYRVIGLDALLQCWREGRLPPARSVAITFDDGYRDNFELAAPILRSHGFTATIFLVSRAVGGVNQWDSAGALAGRPVLTWDQVKALQTHGIDMGGHSRNHRPLAGMRGAVLEDEIAGCKHDLEQQLQGPVATFAYPHGRYDEAVQDEVRRAGFAGACCSEPGVNDPAVCIANRPWALRRLEVRGTDRLADFALMLAAGRNRVVSRLIRSQ